MTKRMLIDASHAEETRVVVLDGSRLEDFDVETSAKRQLKGNIYLAKVVRVEPSLQAAFVEYGGNRHGFLAFSEIHPDYYQIPVADRQRLLAMEAEEARREEEEADLELALDAATSGVEDPEAPNNDPAAMFADIGPGSLEVPARPLAIEPETLSGPIDGADLPAEGPGSGTTGPLFSPLLDDRPTAAEPASPSTETAPEPDATTAIMPKDVRGDGAEPGRISDAGADPRVETGAENDAADMRTDAGTGFDVVGSPAGSVATERAADAPGEAAPGVESAGLPAAKFGVEATETNLLSTTAGMDGPGSEAGRPLGAGSAEITDRFDPAVAALEPQTEPARENASGGAGSTVPAGVDPTSAESEPAHDADDEYLDPRDSIPESPPPETVGGDSDSPEERVERRLPPRFMRNYKIQEVIRRRQILLVQVVKEERGTKGAALTTYLSLAGRFSVLMPNSPRGGGISRKITSATDRRRLKEVMTELDIPRGMGLIVRTAGANRPKPEIRRDCEYLLRLWDDIREHTLKSVAPALIYEEASLIKRAIRDVYSRDVDDILVDGDEGWHAAHDFMRMLMPTHAKKVQLWRDPMPLFARQQVEAQLEAMLQPIVQLRSGGYLVINQTEALVAIDVNSGRSTRERGIEETALRTNLEAADELARQLRLRDLAGLIVIDFIDMELKKHNSMVERRLKEALRHDRARIQIGHISHFGLLEMSRQRLRPSLAETSFVSCAHCGGTGHVRSTESAAVHVLRGVEDEGGKRRAAEIVVHVATPIALYLLNHKRERLREIEQRYAMRVIVAADDGVFASNYRIERLRPQLAGEVLPFVTPDLPQGAPMAAAAVAEAEADEDETADEEDDDEEAEEVRAEGQDATADGSVSAEDAERHRRRRRRRRRGGRREDGTAALTEDVSTPESEAPGSEAPGSEAPGIEAGPAPAVTEPIVPEAAEGEVRVEGVPEPLTESPESPGGPDEEEARNRRRGRRGGRRRRREPEDGELAPVAELDAEQPDLAPAYTGPTPANPFGSQAFDIFDVLDQAEQTTSAPRPAAAAEARLSETLDGPLSGPAAMVAASEPAALDEPLTTTVAATRVEPADVTGGDGPVTAAGEMTATSSMAASMPEPDGAVWGVDATVAQPVSIGMPEPAVSSNPQAELAIAGGGLANPARPAEVGSSAAVEPPTAANDAQGEPAVKPILVGSADAPPAQKKRGWWRRS